MVERWEWVNIARDFLQGDSYFNLGFFLTEVPIVILLEVTDGYNKMELPGEREL